MKQVKSEEKKKNYAVCMSKDEEERLTALGKGSRSRGYQELLRLIAIGFQRKIEESDVGE